MKSDIIHKCSHHDAHAPRTSLTELTSASNIPGMPSELPSQTQIPSASPSILPSRLKECWYLLFEACKIRLDGALTPQTHIDCPHACALKRSPPVLQNDINFNHTNGTWTPPQTCGLLQMQLYSLCQWTLLSSYGLLA
ncbi:hypothetical protein AZE42_11842 [Rhizopogon vesiculosus]|uniref:Uncharacterized protein n=1 Tax=Rhizopogon vesiculosus TaxID=180088 RepID=A0A1J8Q5X9_9AGAM|nr:hypothetical protein AZE42_11842 [Rhizopogon vesiculosus]